jgi:hypothetical protein
MSRTKIMKRKEKRKMTAFEMFKDKYEKWLKNVTEREWENIKIYATAKQMTIPDYMMMCLEITKNECNPQKNANVYWELIKLNEKKLIASNRRNGFKSSREINRFWLTKKGLKEYNKVVNA